MTDRTKELKRVLRMVVARIIKDGSDPQEINSGLCSDFASIVWDNFGRAMKLEFEEAYDEYGCGHTWLSYMGKHYDAEAVDGVADPRHLPIFIRNPDLSTHI